MSPLGTARRFSRNSIDGELFHREILVSLFSTLFRLTCNLNEGPAQKIVPDCGVCFFVVATSTQNNRSAKMSQTIGGCLQVAIVFIVISRNEKMHPVPADK